MKCKSNDEINRIFYEMVEEECDKTHNEIMNEHFNDVLPYILETV